MARKHTDDIDTRFQIANDDYEENKAKARLAGRPGSVTVGMYARKHGFRHHQLSDWRLKNGYTRAGRLSMAKPV